MKYFLGFGVMLVFGLWLYYFLFFSADQTQDDPANTLQENEKCFLSYFRGLAKVLPPGGSGYYLSDSATGKKDLVCKSGHLECKELPGLFSDLPCRASAVGIGSSSVDFNDIDFGSYRYYYGSGASRIQHALPLLNGWWYERPTDS